MAISTERVESIKDACEAVVEAAEELLELREDEEADPDDKRDANETFMDAWNTLKTLAK